MSNWKKWIGIGFLVLGTVVVTTEGGPSGSDDRTEVQDFVSATSSTSS